GNVTVNALLKRDSVSIWVCSDIGLYSLNLNNEKMILDSIIPAHPVLAAAIDRKGNTWFGTNNGLYQLSDGRIKQIFSSRANDPNSLSDNYINAFCVDSDNRLWIGTRKGLNLYNEEEGTFTRFFSGTSMNSLSGNDIVCISEDRNGGLWIGSSLDGLDYLTIQDEIFSFRRILSGSIRSVTDDQKKYIWVGHSSGEGVHLIDFNEFEKGNLLVTRLSSDPLDPNTLNDNSIFTLFLDRFDDVWVGTFGGGANLYSYRTKKFYVVKERSGNQNSIRNNLVNVFFEEEDYLWIGTEGGLDRYDKQKGVYKHYQYERDDPNSLGSNPVLSIYKDSRGHLWVGTWAGGLNLYDYEKDRFKRFLPGPDEGSIGSANIFCIMEDSRKNLWIGTNGGGLNRYDYTTGKFKKYINDPNDSTSFKGRSMSDIFESSNGDLYISMYNLLEKYNYETDDFQHIYRNTPGAGQGGTLLYLTEDSRNNIWVATNAGLEHFNPQTNTFKRYTMNDGLPDNTIQGILDDGQGNLWLSTNRGLSKFINGIEMPEVPSFQNFTLDDGLPANDFKKKAAYKNEEGIMYFGSSRGFIYFHPDSILLNQQIPTLVFTDFLLLQTQPNQNSKFRAINLNVNIAPNLELHYPHTDFTISFAALNYLNSQKNQFQYKLDGYDTEWIDAGNNTSATYTNLSEGVYTFMIKGSNNDGIWNPVPRELAIEIFPLWWRTLVFKVLMIFLILFSVAVYIFTRFAILNRENRLLEAIVDKRTNELSKLNSLLEKKQTIILEQNQELAKHRSHLETLVEERTSELAAARARAEESDRLKSAFLANMSHEIRTPMNAIVGFSNLLTNDDLTFEKKQKYADLIKNNSKLLFVLINDIIDISIIEANQMVLSQTRFNVSTILRELLNYFEMENNKGLKFNFINQAEPDDFFLYNDAIRFRQVMVNLLSNAFKYTDSGKIDYGYEPRVVDVRFFVSDTGSGVDASDQEKIFDHFYKSLKDKTKLYRGTGIGLAICKKLVTQMGGKIWVESEPGKGSVFSFTLPFNSF
ncbi:MAG TPA: two-component regulator propeller domain-containing protein, partial [Prolixibacteraceae bacterium]|nr:two-component regulator propeller domain-containing protein [Prolixibacteraceae bacterium]